MKKIHICSRLSRTDFDWEDNYGKSSIKINPRLYLSTDACSVATYTYALPYVQSPHLFGLCLEYTHIYTHSHIQGHLASGKLPVSYKKKLI